MKAQLQMVREFMRAFGQRTPNSPEMPDGSVQYLRHSLCAEESKELGDARNLEEYLDAVCDLQYVTLGAAAAAGFDAKTLDRAFAEVHRSNMTKLWTQEEIQAVRFGDNTTSLGDQSGGQFDNRYTVTDTGINTPRRYVVTRQDGKVIKAPGYTPANLEQLIRKGAA